MDDTNLDEVAEFLNTTMIENGGRNPDLYEADGHFVNREGKSALGRSYAAKVLEEFGIIVVKTLYIPDDDTTRIWFAEVSVEEEEVTEVRQKVTL